MVAGKLDLQKRQHRERAQPLARKKLGLLEKHADYVKRARDFHSKEDRIKKLREKASAKNKDEFYFGMIKSRTLKGVHVQSRGNEPLPTDLVKVLKTQDAGYIRTQKSIEASRVKRLQQQLDALVDNELLAPVASTSARPVRDEDDDDFAFDFMDEDDELASSAPKRNHILFTSDLETVRNGDPSVLLSKRKRSSPAETGAPAAKKSKKGKGKAVQNPLQDAALLAEEEEARRTAATEHRQALTTELSARQTRLTALSRALRELDVQRLLMGKGAKQALVPKKNKVDPRDVTDDWEDEGKGKGELPDAEEGIATAARVWKWKAQRKR